MRNAALVHNPGSRSRVMDITADSGAPMSHFKRTQRKYVKKAYRVLNWREYEAGLRNRGSLTV